MGFYSLNMGPMAGGGGGKYLKQLKYIIFIMRPYVINMGPMVRWGGGIY